MNKFAALIFISTIAWYAEAAEYSPQGHEQFVFAELPAQLQKYGYDKFCTDSKSAACMYNLNYKQHVGVKGYFSTEKPVHKDYYGAFWPVVLETGEEYFYRGNKDGGKYGSGSPIISLEQYQRISSFTTEPLVQGSGILIQSVKAGSKGEEFLLSSGDTIDANKLASIRKISDFFPSVKSKVADLLVKFDIEQDEVEGFFYIQSKSNILRSEARLYVGVSPVKQWLQMKIKYYGDDWLFVSSYKVAADEHRWQSGTLQFERDNSGGDVWEWIDKSPNKQDLNNLKALSKARSPVIRFQGRQYYSDFKLEPDQQEAIAHTIELFDVMSTARRKR
jgi:hypothetical protein